MRDTSFELRNQLDDNSSNVNCMLLSAKHDREDLRPATMHVVEAEETYLARIAVILLLSLLLNAVVYGVLQQYLHNGTACSIYS